MISSMEYGSVTVTVINRRWSSRPCLAPRGALDASFDRSQLLPVIRDRCIGRYRKPRNSSDGNQTALWQSAQNRTVQYLTSQIAEVCHPDRCHPESGPEQRGVDA
jgi:hypothetical protein